MGTAAAITLEECAARLAAIVGQEHLQVAGETIIATPGDVKQIAQILSFANANEIAVTPAGSGTKLDWGNAVDAGIRLDLRRLSALREHAWQDMTCTVEAGCTWSTMQAELARRGQMVALDPLWLERATVGGVAATNDSGAMRLKYGGLRDLIIGMTVVLADGTIAKTGGKVVKNVAGYDLHKLMTGSFGTLGVIAQVNFRLHPAETLAHTWTAVATEPVEFGALLRSLLDSQLTPSSIQMRAGEKECALDIRIAAPLECMSEQTACLKKICGRNDLQQSDQTVWQARQNLFEVPGAVVLKAAMLPSEICPVCTELRQVAARRGLGVDIVAQANGLLTIALAGDAESAAALIDHLRAKLQPAGGSVVVLRAPAELRSRIDVWECRSNSLPLMREIKHRFDPNRILNPGRFAGII
jgi:glycolate oxidase FAD binding subunit